MTTTTTRDRRDPRLDPERVMARRYALGLLQRELAERAGVSPQMVCDIEAGRRSGSTRTRARIAAALNVPVEELYA